MINLPGESCRFPVSSKPSRCRWYEVENEEEAEARENQHDAIVDDPLLMQPNQDQGIENDQKGI